MTLEHNYIDMSGSIKHNQLPQRFFPSFREKIAGGAGYADWATHIYIIMVQWHPIIINL